MRGLEKLSMMHIEYEKVAGKPLCIEASSLCYGYFVRFPSPIKPVLTPPRIFESIAVRDVGRERFRANAVDTRIPILVSCRHFSA